MNCIVCLWGHGVELSSITKSLAFEIEGVGPTIIIGTLIATEVILFLLYSAQQIVREWKALLRALGLKPRRQKHKRNRDV
jgi:hypothetical protein